MARRMIVSVSLPPDLVAQIDRERGELSRSAWIVRQAERGLGIREAGDDRSSSPLASREASAEVLTPLERERRRRDAWARAGKR